MADPITTVRTIALSHPDATEGIACEGTALEKHTAKVNNKAFAFFSRKDLMIKLGDSLPEATTLAEKTPGMYKVGKNGWATIVWGDGGPLPMALITRWVAESYLLTAGPAKAPSSPKTSSSAKTSSSPKRSSPR